MIKKNQRALNLVNYISDFLINILSLVAAYYLRFRVFDAPESHQPLEMYIRVGILNGVIAVFIYAVLRLYEPKRRTSFIADISIIVRANVVDLLALGLLFYFMRIVDFSRMLLGIFFVLSTGLVILKHLALRWALRYARGQGYNIKHILLIGDGELAKKYAHEIDVNTKLGYHIDGAVVSNAQRRPPLGHLEVLGTVEELDDLLHKSGYDEAVIAFDEDEPESVKAAIQACNRNGVRFSIIPAFSKYIFSAAAPQVETVGGVQMFDFCASPLDRPLNKIIKRLFDIVLSFLILVVLSPLFLVVAISIKLSSKGPVLFKQKRVGYKKKTFNMYKFRSMQVNAEQDTAWSVKGDSRTTAVGRLIRKTSIDELPQLINVLKGDMSLIGPRPEIPYHVEHFRDEIPYYMARHQIRPGLSGWAQVNGFRGDTSIAERVKYDLYYIYNWSFLFDLQILIKTVFGGIISGAE